MLLEAPRVLIENKGEPSSGAESAPVTIVEFSDFQCPACGRAAPTVKRLLQQYEGRVRFVFRDFPLTMHPEAPKAAEAAACAGEQGRFWDMHDQLFRNQRSLKVVDLKRYASELKLDPRTFESCLDSGAQTSHVKADIAAGRRLGVSGTPTFFINGRLLNGAQPYEALANVIEEELARSAR